MITIAKLDGVVKNNQTGKNYQQGEQIDANDVLVVVSGAVLLNVDGKPMSFGVGDLIDQKLILPSTTVEATVVPTPTPTQSEIESGLAAGKDITEILAPAAAGGVTAAGPGGEEGGEGSNFVVVEQLAAQGLVESGYPTGPITFATNPEVEYLGTPLVSTIDITPAPPEPPPPLDNPIVSVDFEVDPGMEKLVGSYLNSDNVSIVITGSDGSSNQFTATLNPDGTWNVDLTGVPFIENVTYTATATATNENGTATATDIDSYDIIEPPPILPTVSVNIEVDPGAEQLVGNYSNADTITVTVTGSDGTTNTYYASLDNGNWSVDLTGVSFSEDVTYTATAVATNSDGTASATDIDSYDIIEPPPILPTVSVDIEVDPGMEKLVGTYTNADTVVVTVTGNDGSSDTYYAYLENGNWSVDLNNITFLEDVTYTATAVASNSDGTVTAIDIDSYNIIEPPILPTVSVDLEVDPGMEQLIGNYTNADSIIITVIGSDGSDNTYYATLDNVNWSVDLTGVTFAEDVTYTATAIASNSDGTATATDIDSYNIIEPPILPTVSVDIEVDPGAEQLIGNYTDADTVVVTVTGSDGSSSTYNALLDNGNWSVDLTGVSFAEDVIYTANALATNSDGTANATDIDSYDIIEPPPNVGGQWFISQSDNHDQQTLPDRYMDEGEQDYDVSVVYQGSGSYFINSGETVTVSLDMWKPQGTNAATFGEDYDIDVIGQNQFVVNDWHIENNQLIVNIVLNDQFNRANLTGNLFDIQFHALTDDAIEGDEVIGFDINTAFHTLSDYSVVQLGAGWETNDDILININYTTTSDSLVTTDVLTSNFSEPTALSIEALPPISYESQMNQLVGEVEQK